MVTSIALLIVGFAGGFLGSEVGAGSMITLPALFFLGLSPATAVATNILSAWSINAVAAFEYWKNKKIQYDIIFHLAPLAFVGAILGSRLITQIDAQKASSIVAVLFAVVFLLIFIVFRKGMAGLQAGSHRYSHLRKFMAAGGAFILGVYGGFFSVGVTTLFIALFVVLLRRSLVEAAADAVTISAVFLTGSMVEFAAGNIINYNLAIPLAIGSVIGAYIGSRVALKFGNHWLRGLVMAMVILVVIKLGYSAFLSTQPDCEATETCPAPSAAAATQTISANKNY